MFCKKCGQPLEAESKYCSACGARLQMDSVVPPKKKSARKIFAGIAAVILTVMVIHAVNFPPTPNGAYKNSYGDILIFKGNMFTGLTFEYSFSRSPSLLGGRYKPYKPENSNIVTLTILPGSNFDDDDGYYDPDADTVNFTSYDEGYRIIGKMLFSPAN